MNSTASYTLDTIMHMPKRTRTNFINSLSGIKSANLIGTTSSDGIDNLALISSVFHVGANPPLIGMLMRPHTVVRDTLTNIKRTGVYTINHVHQNIVEQAHQCSARYAPEQSEFSETGLTPLPSLVVDAPYVAESHIRIAVELAQITVIELNQTELVIGKIVEVICDEATISDDGYLDIEKSDSVGVSGLDSYHSLNHITRYEYAKPDQTLRKKSSD